MEGHRNETGEGSRSDTTDNVNTQLAIALTQIAEYFKRQETRAETSETADDVALERFQKFRPPKFNGETGEEMAEKWIEAIEDIYRVLKYTEERKISFGEFQLEGPAKAWWRVVEERWVQEGRQRTWSAFLEEFRKKFIPLVIREKREAEFINLKQETLTVAQYEIQFTKLSRYAPEMVDTEVKRRRRFLQGLNVKIQNALVTARMDTYAEVVEFAQRIEDSQARVKEFQNSKKSSLKNWKDIKESSSQGQAKRPQNGIGESFRKRPSNQRQEIDTREKKARTTCRHCGRSDHQKSECWKKDGKCLKCGSPEHQIRNCPLIEENP